MVADDAPSRFAIAFAARPDAPFDLGRQDPVRRRRELFFEEDLIGNWLKGKQRRQK